MSFASSFDRAMDAARSWRRLATVVFVLALAGALLAVSPPTVSGQTPTTFTVNSTADKVDNAPADGECDTGDTVNGEAECTLRAAIMEANQLNTTIEIVVPAGTYPLTRTGSDDTAVSGDLDVTNPNNTTTVKGDGTGATIIDANAIDDRHFEVETGVEFGLEDLALVGGQRTTTSNSDDAANGGSVDNDGTLTVTRVRFEDNTSSLGGGALDNNGTATVSDSLFIDNHSDGDLGNSDGGAVHNDDAAVELTIERTLFTANTANDGEGGALEIEDGTLTIVSSTFSANSANDGGALEIDGGTTRLENVTLNENEASSGNAGAIESGDPLKMVNTVIANSRERGSNDPVDNCEGSGSSLESLGHNISTDGSCELTATNDQPNTDPLLEALADNGGETETHALEDGSPAIDAGDDSECADTDQRGVTRPLDGDEDGTATCDIGAFELGAPPADDGDTARPPRANDDEVFATQDRPVRIDVLANDENAPGRDGDIVVRTILEEPDNGTARVSPDQTTVVYEPDDGFVGEDTFEYQIRNEEYRTNPADVFVTVEPAGDVSHSCPEGEVPSSDFEDVSSDSPHLLTIDCMAWADLVEGRTETEFAPADDVTRAQMASLAARLLRAAGTQVPEDAPNAFTDTCADAHEDNVNAMAELGVVEAHEGNRYDCAEPMLRGEIAAVLVHAYQVDSGETLEVWDDYFTDDDGHPREAAINKAFGAGFTVGKEDGTYGPDDTLRRDQTASFFARVLNRLVYEGHAAPPSS